MRSKITFEKIHMRAWFCARLPAPAKHGPAPRAWRRDKSDGTAPGHLYFFRRPDKTKLTFRQSFLRHFPPGSPKKKTPPGGAEHQPTCKLHQRAPQMA